ncbi:MAG: Gfo/Idh/MocA family oxidoreductase [Cyanobacteria bacterium]|jgi:predicted dehydrogenase|nr:Gfo/Idh/MocA family oxidoreductase [Cyanobacteria bacterium GSL.Bin21]
MKQVIVVGAGNWGKNLIRNFYELSALAGIVEVDRDRASEIASQYPTVKIFSDYESALATAVDGIVIATPAGSHYNLALTALQAGKDVFVEKPMTLKTSQAEELARYADQQGRILMVGHLLLYQSAIAWMREYLATGKAGKVFHVATQRTKLGRVRREENVWWSFAPHDISVVLDLLGSPPLQNLQAQGQAMLQPKIEDNVHVDLVFEGGQTAHIHCSWYAPLLQRTTTVIAEKQMLVYDEVSQAVTVYDKTVDDHLNNQDQGSWQPEIEQFPPLQQECKHFLECLKNRQQPRSNGWNGVAVVNILEKGQYYLYS